MSRWMVGKQWAWMQPQPSMETGNCLETETLTPLVVDMGKEVEIAGFSYAPAQEEDLTGTIYKYNFMSAGMVRIG